MGLFLDSIDPHTLSVVAATVAATLTATGLLAGATIAWILYQRRKKNIKAKFDHFKVSEGELQASQRTLTALMGSLPGMVYRCRNDHGWIVDFISEGYKELTGFSAKKLYGHRKTRLAQIIHPDDREKVWSEIETALRNRESFILVYRIITVDGSQKWVREYGQGTFSVEGKPLTIESFVTDVTKWKQAEDEIRMNESRLEILLQLNQMADSSLEEICDFALDRAVSISRSKIGYLAFVSDDESELSVYAWSKRALSECAIDDKQTVFEVDETGLWGEAIKRRKPIITNDYNASCSGSRGCPHGNVDLSRCLNVPIFDLGKIVTVIGVANKDEDYTATDARQLTLLIQGMWRIIQRKQAEHVLRKSEERFLELGRMLPAVAETDEDQLVAAGGEMHSSD